MDTPKQRNKPLFKGKMFTYKLHTHRIGCLAFLCIVVWQLSQKRPMETKGHLHCLFYLGKDMLLILRFWNQ